MISNCDTVVVNTRTKLACVRGTSWGESFCRVVTQNVLQCPLQRSSRNLLESPDTLYLECQNNEELFRHKMQHFWENCIFAGLFIIKVRLKCLFVRSWVRGTQVREPEKRLLLCWTLLGQWKGGRWDGDYKKWLWRLDDSLFSIKMSV